jgi:predicted RNase H-like nuclease (RuvC/YqgF family)
MARNFENKDVKLRTALFGFKKSDVIHYLGRMNAAAESEHMSFMEASRDAQNFYIELAEADRRIAGLSERNAQLEAENEKLKAENSKLTDKLSKAPADIDELINAKAEVESLKRAVEELKTKLAAKSEKKGFRFPFGK